jgi:hypothetical protein
MGVAQTNAVICPSNGKLISIAHKITGAATSDAVLVQSTVPDSNGLVSWTTAQDMVAINTGCAAGQCIGGGTPSTTATYGGVDDVSMARFDLSLDSSNKLTVAGLSYQNPATTFFTATMAAACGTLPSDLSTAAAGALGTGLVVAGAETLPGKFGFRVVSNGTQSFALYTSNTAQEVRIARTNAGAWAAATNSVEGTLAGLVAGEGVSFAYDSSTDMLYGAYAALPGSASNAEGQDIKVAYVPSADVPTSVQYPLMGVDVVDQTYTVFPSTSTPSFSAARSTRTGSASRQNN